jgi:hypothetical protein
MNQIEKPTTSLIDHQYTDGNPIGVTRFMYPVKSCKESLLNILNTGTITDLETCIYWTMELFYSGYDLFEFLERYFIDNFGYKYPKLITMFSSDMGIWVEQGAEAKTDQYNNLIFIVTNLFRISCSERCGEFVSPILNLSDCGIRIYSDFHDTKQETELFALNIGLSQLPAIFRTCKNRDWASLASIIATASKLQNGQRSQCYKIIYDYHNPDQSPTKMVQWVIARHETGEHDWVELLNCYIWTFTGMCETPKLIRPSLTKLMKWNLKYGANPESITSTEKQHVPLYKKLLIYTENAPNVVATKSSDWICKVRANWTWHACSTPVWFNRIQMHGGIIDVKSQSISWQDEDLEEDFYELYELDLDEQPQRVYDKLS